MPETPPLPRSGPPGLHDLAGKRVWVTGHRGMVGAAMCRRLAREGCEILTTTRAELDLTRQAEVEAWMADAKPDVIVLAAARVGGILANDSHPVDFLVQNLQIETNVMTAAHACDVDRLLFLGSSCIYPRMAPQPIPEDSLMTGPLEPTNEWYATAKIAGIRMVQAYRRQHGRDWISAMPTNLYGPGDNYDPRGSHVLAALLRKFHEARETGAAEVELWGSGTPLREFLHCDDLADALVFLLHRYSDPAPINVGSGVEVSIRELALAIARTVGYEARLTFDPAMPDGTPRKLMDCTRLHGLGWNGARPLDEGLRDAYAHFLAGQADAGAPPAPGTGTGTDTAPRTDTGS